MDRYSFFISNSFLSGYSVSAVGELSDHLSNRSERYIAIGGDISSNDQDSLSSDTVDAEPQEVQSSEVDPQNREEIRNQIGLKEPENFDNEGNFIDDNYVRPEMPESITSDEVLPEASEDRVNNGWRFGMDPLMSRAINWASYPGTVRAGPNNGYYITGYFKAWNIAGTTNFSMVADNIDMITMQARKSFAALEWNETQLGSEVNRAHNRLDSLGNFTNTVSSEVSRAHRRLDSLSGSFSDLSSENARAHRRLDSLGDFVNTVSASATRANNRLDSLGNTVSALSGVINTVSANADRANNRLDSLGNTVSTLSGVINRVSDNADRANNRLDSLGNTVSALSGAINTVEANADRANKRLDTLGDTVSALSGSINSVKDNADRANRRLDSFSISVDNRFEELEGKIGNSSWSDVGIIAGLGLIKDSVDSFKTAFTDLFSVDDLVGLSAHEGKFTRMIKSQFIALRNDLRDLFKTYFGVEMDGEIPTPTGLFSKLLDDLIYKVRYTTIQEFSELKELLESQGTIFLENLNLVNDSLLAIRQNQISISEWLKLIYEKPVGNVIAPPFDFDRLAKIIADNMPEMGGGESGWLKQAIKTAGDIIKTGIETMGELLGKGIDGLVDIASKILDFLDGLIDKLLALIIPDNWDFLDKGFGDISKEFNLKFELFLDLGGTIKDIFTPNKKDFFSAVSWSYLGVTFDGQEAKPIMDQFVPKFRTLAQVSIWLMVAWWVYRKVTGSGDLINDN